ncbi:MotA/TolQ/ExbB proton channel family protein [Campylobacter majalis]|uniref:MotA/TolQ/ExbB proton channel family protein n=1 Tax=Campylobacter majalis TaxID=2790656 RepID=UPI003D69856A
MKKFLAIILFFTFCFADSNLTQNLDVSINLKSDALLKSLPNNANEGQNTINNDSISKTLNTSKTLEQNTTKPLQNLNLSEQNTTQNLATTAKDEKSHIDMSFGSLFDNAHIVVKAVIGILILFSVITWTVFLAKFTQFTLAFSRLKKDENTLKNGDLSALKNSQKSFGKILFIQINDEISKTAIKNEAFKLRVKERLALKCSEFVHQSKSYTGILASIGSSAPFIGLFGTVWGIMSSFIGIANEGNASLSVVAPGIAEALFATALGLVAAIPAVLMYNCLIKTGLNFNARLNLLASHIYLCFDRECENDTK